MGLNANQFRCVAKRILFQHHFSKTEIQTQNKLREAVWGNVFLKERLAGLRGRAWVTDNFLDIYVVFSGLLCICPVRVYFTHRHSAEVIKMSFLGLGWQDGSVG